MTKDFKNYGEIDYEDHEIENKLKIDEKLNKELNIDEDEPTKR